MGPLKSGPVFSYAMVSPYAMVAAVPGTLFFSFFLSFFLPFFLPLFLPLFILYGTVMPFYLYRLYPDKYIFTDVL